MQAIRFFEQATPLGNELDYILISGGSGRNGFGSLTTLNSAEIFLPGADGFVRPGTCSKAARFMSPHQGLTQAVHCASWWPEEMVTIPVSAAQNSISRRMQSFRRDAR